MWWLLTQTDVAPSPCERWLAFWVATALLCLVTTLCLALALRLATRRS